MAAGFRLHAPVLRRSSSLRISSICHDRIGSQQGEELIPVGSHLDCSSVETEGVVPGPSSVPGIATHSSPTQTKSVEAVLFHRLHLNLHMLELHAWRLSSVRLGTPDSLFM